MQTSKILLAVFTAIAIGNTAMAQTADADQYRQQQAAARKDAQRARQAERADYAKHSNANSEVAQETAAYLAEMARVQKHNNEVADYMTRDIAHRLAVWLDLGACSRLDHIGMKGSEGFNIGGGGALGIGYQLRRSKFLFTTGIEFRSINYNSVSLIDPSQPLKRVDYYLGYLQLPLMFGMELPNWYWQLGGKVGYKVMDVKSNINSDLRYAPAFEIGMNFDRWSRPQLPAGQQMTPAQRRQFRMHYKLALFGECGLIDKPNPAAGTTRFKEDLTVGFKFTAAYQFRRQQKKMEPLPTRPRPAMTVLVKDANGRPAEGVMVVAHDRVSNGKSYGTTLPDGKAVINLARGEYDLRAYRNGKMAEPLHIEHLDLNGDAYELILNQEDDTPAEVRIVDYEEVTLDPNLPRLVGRVCDAETGAPLNAGVRVGNWIDTTALYHGTANSRGIYVTRLYRGDYSVHVRKAGYMPLIDAIHFEQDSVILKLKPIRVGTAAKVKDLFFVKDKATLLPESETALANLAMFLRQNPDVCIKLTAHTDNQGDEDRLIRMSLARARMIRRNLVNRGIDINRIEINGMGGTQPVADNESEYGRALNQRIVMEITSLTGPAPATEE